MNDAFVRSTTEVLAHFGVAEHTGLSDSQVNTSRDKHGSNGAFGALHITASGTDQKPQSLRRKTQHLFGN